MKPTDKEHESRKKGFIEACEPLMKWLAENCHPHAKVIMHSTCAELVEGEMSHKTDEFLVD